MTVEPEVVEARRRHVAAVVERQREVMARVVDRAAARDDPRWWTAAARQARRFARVLEPWERSRALDGAGVDLQRHRRDLEAHAARAEARLAAANGAAASADAGLRVAFVGKGGIGKTFIAATLARVLARRGRRVLAADLDSNPGLALGLGLAADAGRLPDTALAPDPGAAYGWAAAPGLDPVDAVDAFAATGADGVRLLAFSKIDGAGNGETKRSIGAVVETLVGMYDPDWDVVGDMEAGTTTPFVRYHAFCDTAVIVVGPTWRSGLTARRLRPIVADARVVVVANQMTDEHDVDEAPAVRIPLDPAVAAAGRAGASVIDLDPDSPALRQVERLADALVGARGHERGGPA